MVPRVFSSLLERIPAFLLLKSIKEVNMKILGIIVLTVGAVITFGADRCYKTGKIKDLRQLVAVKLTGFIIALSGVAAVVMSMR